MDKTLSLSLSLSFSLSLFLSLILICLFLSLHWRRTHLQTVLRKWQIKKRFLWLLRKTGFDPNDQNRVFHASKKRSERIGWMQCSRTKTETKKKEAVMTSFVKLASCSKAQKIPLLFLWAEKKKKGRKNISDKRCPKDVWETCQSRGGKIASFFFSPIHLNHKNLTSPGSTTVLFHIFCECVGCPYETSQGISGS